MIKLLIVDDQAVLRESIKFRVNFDKDIEVVGSVGNGREAIELCARYLPDIILMDIVMPVCDGIEATKIIKSKYPLIKIIILTTFIDDQNISKAMQNGADGYVLKDIEPDELVDILKNTAKGLRVLHQNVFNTLLNKFNSETEAVQESHLDLSDKEIEIIRLIVKGKNTKEIASSVFLSEGRVKNIITDILSKLKLKDRIQLAVFAVKNGLI